MSSYLEGHLSIMKSINIAVLDTISAKLLACKGKILCIGNGGSCATASHMAEDLYMCGLNIYTVFDPPHMTCIANDFGYSEVFSLAVDRDLTEKDILVLFSGSGNSENIVNAVNHSKATVIGFVGKGGIVNKLCDLLFEVPSYDIQHIEDIHLFAVHYIYKIIKGR